MSWLEKTKLSKQVCLVDAKGIDTQVLMPTRRRIELLERKVELCIVGCPHWCAM